MIQKRYCFDPLFYRFLLRRFLQISPTERSKTTRLIAGYLENEGNYVRLIWYLLTVGEADQARLAFEQYADDLYRALDQDSFRKMLEAFPESFYDEEPKLTYYYALSTSLVRPVTTRKKLLDLVPVFLEAKDYEKVATIYAGLLINSLFYHRSTESMVGLVTRSSEFLSGYGTLIGEEQREILEVIIPLGKWWTGDDEDLAFRMALQAEETSFRFRNEEAYLCARFVLSRIYLEKGDFQEARRLLHRTEAYLETQHVSGLFTALAVFYLGDMYFYVGEINTAVDRIEQELKQCPDDFAFRYYLEINLIIYTLYQEDISKAESLYDLTENLEIEENLYVRYFSRFLVQMLIAYRNGNRQRAEYFCRRLLNEENQALMRVDFPYSYLALAEVCLYLDRFDDVQEILSPLLTDDFCRNHPYPSASARSLMILLYEKTGRKDLIASSATRML